MSRRAVITLVASLGVSVLVLAVRVQQLEAVTSDPLWVAMHTKTAHVTVADLETLGVLDELVVQADQIFADGRYQPVYYIQVEGALFIEVMGEPWDPSDRSDFEVWLFTFLLDGQGGWTYHGAKLQFTSMYYQGR